MFAAQCLTLILLLLATVTSVHGARGTTPHIREVFIGHCLYLQNERHPEYFDELLNCTEVWESFYEAWSYKDPCAIEPELYKQYAELTAHPLPSKGSLLWEGARMHQLSAQYADYGSRFVVMSDTLSGYVGQMSWCGQEAEPGINYEECPPFSDCHSHVTMSYWRQTSTKYAEALEGEVMILLNGSAVQAYENDTESCGEGSLKVVEDILIEFGHNVQCMDDPRDIMHLLCVDHKDHPDCQFAAAASSANSNRNHILKSLVQILASLMQHLINSLI